MSKQTITTRCSQYQHPDFILNHAPEILPESIATLVSYLEESVAAGTRFETNQTIQYASIVLQISRQGGYFLIQEPDFKSIPVNWIDSINQTVAITRFQVDIADSYGLRNEITPPSICDSLIISKDLTPNCDSFILDRFAPKGSDSGWFIGRGDTSENYNDPEKLTRISVYEAFINWPTLAGFLALPPGCLLKTTPLSTSIWHNDAQLFPTPGSFIEAWHKLRS